MDASSKPARTSGEANPFSGHLCDRQAYQQPARQAHAHSVNNLLPELIQYLDMPNFTVYLLAEDLLTYEEREIVLTKPRRDCQAPELLRVLQTKGAGWYERFLCALQKSASGPEAHLGHQHLLEVLPTAAVAEQWSSSRTPSHAMASSPPSPARALCASCAMDADASFWGSDASSNWSSPTASIRSDCARTSHENQTTLMLQRFASISQQCQVMGAFAAEVSREMAAMEPAMVSVTEENKTLCGERSRVEERLRELEKENRRLRKECVELREWKEASEPELAYQRQALATQEEGFSMDLILQSSEMEDIDAIKSVASQNRSPHVTKSQSPAHLKMVLLANLQSADKMNDGITTQVFQAVDGILGRAQSVSADSTSSLTEMFYPESNTKVSVAMIDTNCELDGEKHLCDFPFVPDLLFYVLSGPMGFNCLPQLAKTLSPTVWERCVVLVSNDPVAVYSKRPFLEMLKQVGVCPQAIARIPFVLLPPHPVPVLPAPCLRQITELFTVSLERLSHGAKSTLVSLNVDRILPSYCVDYTHLQSEVYNWPIALTKHQADRCLRQLQNRHHWKSWKLSVSALKLTAPIVEKLCSTVM